MPDVYEAYVERDSFVGWWWVVRSGFWEDRDWTLTRARAERRLAKRLTQVENPQTPERHYLRGAPDA